MKLNVAGCVAKYINMSDESGMMKIGWDTNGLPWDEKGHSDIVQIFISHRYHYIISIQFQYVEDGRLVLSRKHGGTVDAQYKFDVVRLNHPKEYITWISGKVHNNSSNWLCSITFGTNHGEYGPFGQLSARDNDFCFKLGQDRQFGGFYGTVDRSNGILKSIGVYLKTISTLVPNTNVKVENA